VDGCTLRGRSADASSAGETLGGVIEQSGRNIV